MGILGKFWKVSNRPNKGKIEMELEKTIYFYKKTIAAYDEISKHMEELGDEYGWRKEELVRLLDRYHNIVARIEMNHGIYEMSKRKRSFVKFMDNLEKLNFEARLITGDYII